MNRNTKRLAAVELGELRDENAQLRLRLTAQEKRTDRWLEESLHLRRVLDMLTEGNAPPFDPQAYVSQAANLWFVKAMIQQRLTQISGQAADGVQIIDTLPLPVCTYTRSQRDRCFKPDADYGYCAAKDLHYYGFKLGLRVSRAGMIIHYPLLPARPHDSQLLDDLIAGFEGVVPADKAFVDGFRQENLARKRHIELVVPARKDMKVKPPVAIMKVCSRWRKLVETVGSHLTERYHIAKTRTHDLWHYQHRLIRKVLSHTVCVFLNLQLGRSPLHLDGLVIVD